MTDRSKKQKEYIFLDESGKPEVYSRKGINLELIINSARVSFTDKYKLDSGAHIVYHHNPHYKREYYDIVRGRIGYIQDIFNKKSYSRSNPL